MYYVPTLLGVLQRQNSGGTLPNTYHPGYPLPPTSSSNYPPAPGPPSSTSRGPGSGSGDNGNKIQPPYVAPPLYDTAYENIALR